MKRIIQVAVCAVAVLLLGAIGGPALAQSIEAERVPFVEMHIERLPEGARGSVQCLGPIETVETTTGVAWQCHSFPDARK